MVDSIESRVQFIYEPVQEELARVKENLRRLSESVETPMATLLGHITDATGKRVRPAVTILSSQFHPHDFDFPVTMATGVELLHIATLIHDDTVDNSNMRRGRATVSSLWGRDVAVLLGDYVFATSATYVCDTGNVRIMRRFAETIMELSTGELAERFSAYNWRQTLQEYKTRIYNKTASLFSTAAESGAILSGAPEEVVQSLKGFGSNIGMAFQIVDDILDFQGTEQEVGKPVGSDLLHGTITLPALLLLEQYSDDNPIKVLSEEEGRKERVREVVEMIQNSTIIQDSYAVAWGYQREAVADLQQLSDNRARHSLEELAHYIMERRR